MEQGPAKAKLKIFCLMLIQISYLLWQVRSSVFIALAVIGLFAFLVLRGYFRIVSEPSLFVFLAVAGLLTQFGFQALIHISSSLQLIPAKGMTLPFISYGGSSFLALSIGMGMVLALTRKRPGREDLI